jgi:hypothetical protein
MVETFISIELEVVSESIGTFVLETFVSIGLETFVS